MLSVAELILRYESYTDEELHLIHTNISSYSSDAQKAFDTVLQKRGGIEKLNSRLTEKQVIQNEVRKVEQETAESMQSGFDEAFIKKAITSTILPAAEMDKIISQKYYEAEAVIADKKNHF
jgi:TPP-dependent trihydroxycyclohexane-1,2-dione (THcHDO) dehydratase